MRKTYYIDIPNPEDFDGACLTMYQTNNKKDALDYVKTHYGADSKGRICLISSSDDEADLD